MMPQVRPSRLPLAFECPSSLLPADHPLGGSSDAAELGQACHWIGGALVLGQGVDPADVARSFRVDEDEVRIVLALMRRAWSELAKFFPAPRVEYHLESTMLGGGTADLIHHDGETAAIHDWKTGRVERTAEHQLAGYAWSVREQLGMPSSGVILTTIAWPRLGKWLSYKWDSPGLDVWGREYEALERRIGRDYNPGEHCGFCPRRLECGAYASSVASSAQALAETQPEAMTAEVLARLYPRVSLLRRAIESYDGMLRASLAGGVCLPTGDGRALSLGEQRKTEIDPRAAWPVLREALGADALAGCVSISKGKVEDSIEGTAPKGQKKAAREELFARLEEAGALTVTIHQRLTAAKE